MRDVSVLMYHGVGDPAPRGELHYTFSRDDFARHLHMIRQRCATASLEDLLRGEAPAGAVVLTFDDGERSVAEQALPLMQQHGMVGAVFVTTGWIGTPGYLEVEHIEELARAGWTVGTHGVTHRFLSDLPPDQIQEELARSRDALGRILGAPPRDASLPGGRVDAAVLATVRATGYRSLCTSVVGTCGSPPTDPFRIRRTMMIRSFDEGIVRRILAGDRRFYAGLRARQTALGLAKRTLGNRRYEALRSAAFAALQKFRR